MSGMLDDRSKFVDGDPRRPANLSTLIPRKGGKSHSSYHPADPGEEAGPVGESDKYAGLGIGVAGLLAENLACHPFVILRRQCQVNVESRRAHNTPITLLPVLINLNRWQGVAVLWKGIGSSLTIKGLNLGMEDCLSKVTPWPKEIDRHSSVKSIGQHLLLKCVSTAVITPFYSASLVETVQSDIASEKPGVLDVFRDGVVRLLSWSDPRCGRMLPVWVLIPPQVIHSIMHYVISTIVQGLWLQVMKSTHREYQRLTGAVSKDPQLSNLPGLSQYQTQASSLMGHFTADLLLYPLETVLHRLHLQGTRSIIDDLDTGREVVPILTRYEGVADCFSTILQEEGFRGLFKGLGALLLQYGVHFLIIKFSSKIISQVAQLFSNTATPRIPFPDSNTVTPRAPIQDPKKEQNDIKETSPRHSNVSVSQHLMEDIPRMSPVNVSSVVTSQSPDLGRSPILTRRTKVPAEFPEEDDHQEVYTRGGGSSVFSPSLGLHQDHGRSGISSDLGLGPSTPVSTNDSSPLSPPRPGLPSLLSFGNSSTRSPQRRILPDMDYDYMKPWRSQDNL